MLKAECKIISDKVNKMNNGERTPVDFFDVIKAWDNNVYEQGIQGTNCLRSNLYTLVLSS